MRFLTNKKSAAFWPAAGSIELQSVVLKYRPELPAVLDYLTMKVRSGEKIGIVASSSTGSTFQHDLRERSGDHTTRSATMYVIFMCSPVVGIDSL